jgi:hypothetical protein
MSLAKFYIFRKLRNLISKFILKFYRISLKLPHMRINSLFLFIWIIILKSNILFLCFIIFNYSIIIKLIIIMHDTMRNHFQFFKLIYSISHISFGLKIILTKYFVNFFILSLIQKIFFKFYWIILSSFLQNIKAWRFFESRMVIFFYLIYCRFSLSFLHKILVWLHTFCI